MTYDKQNEHFLMQHKENDTQGKSRKTNADTIICQTTSNSKQNKFNKANNLTNTRLEMMKFCSVKAQPQQQKQKQQLIQAQIGPKSSCTEQTIIRKVFKQEMASTMAQQASQPTHMTLKEYFEFSNDAAATNMASNAAAKITIASANKRINKQKCGQQKEQNRDLKNNSNKACVLTINSGKQQHQHQHEHKHELLWQAIATETAKPATKTIANTTDPAVMASSLPTITTLSTLSSWLSLALPTIQTTLALRPAATTVTPVKADNNNDGNDNDDDYGNDENSQSKLQQQQKCCNNVCLSSTISSTQKCMPQHKKQQQHCKSANMSCNRFYTQTNGNIFHLTKAEDASNIAAIKNTTTNKANTINSYTMISATATTASSNSTNNSTSTTAFTAATGPTATLTTALLLPSPSPSPPPPPAATAAVAATVSSSQIIPAFPLRQLLKNTKQLECLLRAACVVFFIIMSMQYQTVSASSSMMSKHEPMFISRSETFKFVAGDTIVLPCEVANTDPYVVAWKRGIAILTAGSVKVTPDPRVRLVNGFNLQIRDAVPQDAGDYICQIATMEPREITHTVEILVPPRIHHISTSGHLQVKKGSSVRIECSASGNPTPNVTWSRKNNILPNGEEKLHSHILSIENVDRHKGGVYICTANNGVGQPASSQVVLHVLFSPEITVERPVVFSGEGHEATLVCIVHGETQPEVIWFKDTMQLDTTERHIMENRGSRHTLIIRKVHPQDFGNYSCVAENQLGKSRKTLQLSGKPNVAVFNSPPISQYKDRYNISWTVESHTPIEEYKLSFRRLQQGQEVDNSIDTHSLHSSSSSIQQMYGRSMSANGGSMMDVNAHNYRLGSIGGYGSYGAGNVMHWGRNDWRDVVLPAVPTSHHFKQGMSYMIRGLDPDQHYEATVQARNRYGWSDYSQSFVFSTSSNDNEMRDLSVTFYGSKAIRADSLGVLLFLTAGTLCLRSFYF